MRKNECEGRRLIKRKTSVVESGNNPLLVKTVKRVNAYAVVAHKHKARQGRGVGVSDGEEEEEKSSRKKSWYRDS